MRIEMARKGPIIVINENVLNNDFLTLIQKLIERKYIKPSVQLFVEAFHQNMLTPEYTDESGSFISFFKACDDIEGKTNPDTKSERPISLSQTTRYRRVQSLQQIGLLEDFNGPIPDVFTSNSGAQVELYVLQKPNTMALSEEIEESQKPLISNVAYREARQEEIETFEQMSFGFYVDRPLQKLGTIELMANFINQMVRPDVTFPTEIVDELFEVKHPITGEKGQLNIISTHNSGSDSMMADDVTMVGYVYSAIQERIKQDLLKQSPNIDNLFRFDKVRIITDHGQKDGGGYRRSLDQQFDRITSNTFKFEATEGALWIMEQFGFIDENGLPYQDQEVRLLERVGNQQDELEGSAKKKLNERKTHRYIDLKLPHFLYKKLQDAYQKLLNQFQADGKQPKEHMLRMFTRSKTLLTHDNKGIGLILVDYFSSKIVEVNKRYGPYPLNNFSSNINSRLRCKTDDLLALSTTEKKEYDRVLRARLTSFNIRLLKILLSPVRIMFHKGLNYNARKEPRVLEMYSLVDKFLVYLENVTPGGHSLNTKLSKIEYRITVVRLDSSDLLVCNEHSARIRENLEYANEEAFESFARKLFASAAYLHQKKIK